MRNQNKGDQTGIDYLREQLNIPYSDVNAEYIHYKMTTAIDLEQYALEQLKQKMAIVITIRQNWLKNDICIAYIFDNEDHLSINVKLENIIRAIEEAGFGMDEIKKIIKASSAGHQEMIISAFEQRQMDKLIAVGGVDTQSILF